jgi:hypothetical protein
MRTFLRLGAMLAAAIVLGSAASAGSSPVANLSLPGGAAYVFPFPDGYCPATTGMYADKAKQTAAGDTTNLTDAAYYPCAEMAANGPTSSWGMLKTPREFAANGNYTREAVIAELGSGLNPALLKKINDLATQVGQHKLAGAAASPAIDPAALLVDTNAVYSGGTLKTQSGAMVAAVYATTVVRKRIFLLYLFKNYQDARDIPMLLSKVQAATVKFVKANS